MKKLMKDLDKISKTLSELTEKVEKMADAIEKEPVLAKPVKKTAAKKKAAPKATKKKAAPKKKVSAKKKAAPKVPGSTKADKEENDTGSMLDKIYGLIGNGPEGTTVAEIKEKSGLAPRQVSNTLYKLTKKGLIDTVSRGVYVKK